MQYPHSGTTADCGTTTNENNTPYRGGRNQCQQCTRNHVRENQFTK